MDKIKQAIDGVRSLIPAVEKRLRRERLYRNVKPRPGGSLGSTLDRATARLDAVRARRLDAERERLERELAQLDQLSERELTDLCERLSADAETARREYNRAAEVRAGDACWAVNQEIRRREDAREIARVPTYRETVNDDGDVRVQRGLEVWYENARGRRVTIDDVRARIAAIRAERDHFPESAAARIARRLGPLVALG